MDDRKVEKREEWKVIYVAKGRIEHIEMRDGLLYVISNESVAILHPCQLFPTEEDGT